MTSQTYARVVKKTSGLGGVGKVQVRGRLLPYHDLDDGGDSRDTVPAVAMGLPCCDQARVELAVRARSSAFEDSSRSPGLIRCVPL